MRYFLFHKPFEVLSNFTGADKDSTLSKFGFPKGIYPVGRLDKDSEGLLLLSDDGPLINKILDPNNNHPRTYLVQVEGVPEGEDMSILKEGPKIKGNYKTKPCEAEILREEPALEARTPPIRMRKKIPTTWIQLTLKEGKNRQVRRMTAAVGFPTLRLIRISIGNLKLAGLGQGEFREIKRGDIKI